MKNICCRGFENMLENKGKRGLSISENKNPYAPYKLISKGIDSSDELRLPELFAEYGKIPLIINISNESTIQYCPWCGTKLGLDIPARKGFD